MFAKVPFSKGGYKLRLLTVIDALIPCLQSQNIFGHGAWRNPYSLLIWNICRKMRSALFFRTIRRSRTGHSSEVTGPDLWI